MSLEIVAMEKKYLEDALFIYQWYVKNSTATFQIHDSTLTEMHELLFFTDPTYRSFAVLENTRCIGYGIITQFKKREAFDRTAEITIYLETTATRKGYGREVLEYLEEFARTQGFHALVALISGENTGSCKLFARNGYTQCAQYREVGFKFNRWIDLVCYEKILFPIQ